MISTGSALTALYTLAFKYNWNHIASMQDRIISCLLLLLLLSHFDPRSQYFFRFWELNRWPTWTFFPSIEDFFESTIYKLLCILIALDTPLISLSSGVNSSSMFHQIYPLNWQKRKRRFQLKTQFSHNRLSKIPILYDKLNL